MKVENPQAGPNHPNLTKKPVRCFWISVLDPDKIYDLCLDGILLLTTLTLVYPDEAQHELYTCLHSSASREGQSVNFAHEAN